MPVFSVIVKCGSTLRYKIIFILIAKTLSTSTTALMCLPLDLCYSAIKVKTSHVKNSS